MSDQTTTVGELRGEIEQFVSLREWNAFHSPKNLAMSIAIEAAEIMEHFQWYATEESIERLSDPVEYAEVREEVADVMIYLLSFCNATNIDAADAVRAKMARNEGRFPVDVVRGRLG